MSILYVHSILNLKYFCLCMWHRERIRPGRRLDSLVLTVFLKVLHSIVQLGFSPTQK